MGWKSNKRKKYERKLESIVISLLIVIILLLLEHLEGYVTKFINKIFGIKEEPEISYNIVVGHICSKNLSNFKIIIFSFKMFQQ